MKKFALAAALSVAATTAFAGGMAEPVTPEVIVEKGDLVIIPAGKCVWVVHQQVRRHYRSDALSPACCII